MYNILSIITNKRNKAFAILTLDIKGSLLLFITVATVNIKQYFVNVASTIQQYTV